LITANLSSLKIHKLSQEQYKRTKEAGLLDPEALYLTPDDFTDERINAILTEAKESGQFDGDRGSIIFETVSNPELNTYMINNTVYNYAIKASDIINPNNIDITPRIGDFILSLSTGVLFPIECEKDDIYYTYNAIYLKGNPGLGIFKVTTAPTTVTGDNSTTYGPYSFSFDTLIEECGRVPDVNNLILSGYSIYKITYCDTSNQICYLNERTYLKGSDGAKGGKGIIRITTVPSATTYTVDGTRYQYRVSLSTVKSANGGVTPSKGDAVLYSYYLYPIGWIEGSYCYFATRTSLKGPEGPSGKTPYIGDNGNWFLGTTDTGVKAQVDTESVITELKTYVEETLLGGSW
jgi:hypothetical protein